MMCHGALLPAFSPKLNPILTPQTLSHNILPLADQPTGPGEAVYGWIWRLLRTPRLP
jgi:hypothetical protein